jgi:hypothetical protein
MVPSEEPVQLSARRPRGIEIPPETPLSELEWDCDVRAGRHTQHHEKIVVDPILSTGFDAHRDPPLSETWPANLV